jgi:NAD(P)-dependent dehydrogenase (short-subunit alcohol dehydrogenase family)
MSDRLRQKTALVTGAGSGIGMAVADRFLAEGARVVYADRDLDAAQRAAGTNGRAARVDISDETDITDLFQELAADGWTPDVVVANAGIQLFGADAPAADLELATWRRTIDTNLTGTFLTLKHAVRAMLPNGGSIIVTGSPTGLRGSEASDFTAYSASKAGVHALALTVAAEYASRGIRVNLVVPGYTETSLVAAISENPDARERITARIPLRRPGRASDVTGIMVYLASDEGAYATGGVFQVDGGISTL